MHIRVRFFASLREVMDGQRELVAEVPEGATVAELCERLSAEYPRLSEFTTNLAYAVNAEYAPPHHRLKDGDEVALIPPVSGG